MVEVEIRPLVHIEGGDGLGALLLSWCWETDQLELEEPPVFRVVARHRRESGRGAPTSVIRTHVRSVKAVDGRVDHLNVWLEVLDEQTFPGRLPLRGGEILAGVLNPFTCHGVLTVFAPHELPPAL